MPQARTSDGYRPLWPGLAADARAPGSPRGSDAIHRRLISVASRLFIEQGYRSTTTKQVCEEAGTTERTLFRHFGSKAGLFEATIVEPFSELVSEWAQSFASYPAERPLAEAIESWVGALVGFVDEHRVPLRMLIAADFDGDRTLEPVAERISEHFAHELGALADEAGALFVRGRQYNIEDPRIALASGVSMALGMILLDKWVFNHEAPEPSREAIVGEIANMVMHGISGRPS